MVCLPFPWVDHDIVFPHYWGYSLKIRPYIDLIYGGYLQSRFLKWPLNAIARGNGDPHRTWRIAGVDEREQLGVLKSWGIFKSPWVSLYSLVGGFKHFLFSIIYGNNHPNWLSYFSEGLKPPTRYSLKWSSMNDLDDLGYAPWISKPAKRGSRKMFVPLLFCGYRVGI